MELTVRHFILCTLTLSLLLALAVRGASPPNLDQALAMQQALAAEYPNDSGVFNDLGNLQRLAGHLEAAEDAYRRALAIDPANVAAHFNLAVLLQQRGKTGAALKALRTVIREAPDHAWAHYQLGVIEDLQGNAERAIEAYSRAFTLDYELAFPEVNPHVIENRHLTAALLRSYQRAEGLQAPNTYQEPARIAALLVPSIPSSATPEEEVYSGGEGVDRSDPRLRPGERDRATGRVLSREDLEAQRALGQATPMRGRPGAARSSRGGNRGGGNYRGRAPATLDRGRAVGSDSGSSASRQPGRRQPQPVTGFAVPNSQIPRPVQNPTPNPGARNPTNDGRGNGGVTRPPGTRFRPGAGSTGQLDHRLVPLTPRPGAPGRGGAGTERAG